MDIDKLDRIVAEAHRNAAQREAGYRERALKMYTRVCGRCARKIHARQPARIDRASPQPRSRFNPPDGSNWELLCVYCHDNEHSRYIDHAGGSASSLRTRQLLTDPRYFPAGLKDMLKR